MRFSRVLAVADRDLRQVGAGRSRIRLPLIALGLLLPAGALPLPRRGPAVDTPADPPVASIVGTVSDEVRAATRPPADGEDAPVHVTGGDHPRVRATGVPLALRRALDTAPGEPKVALRAVRRASRPALPERSLLVVLLAVSLLTGPLAESLPGERARGTLEVLLSTAITRRELVTGKWLAWTAAASSVGLAAALTGVLTGVQPMGWWIVGVPAAVGAAVAFGLWLVRGVADVVSGATAPMRVVPLVALVAAGVAWAVAAVHPLLGAAVPLGGALLVAGGVLHGPAAALVGAAGSLAGTAVLIAWIAADLDRWGRRTAQRSTGAFGLAAAAMALWWLAVCGPAIWALAGNAGLQLSLPAAASAGGLLCLLAALVAAGRDGRLAAPGPAGRPLAVTPAALLAGLAIGALLSVASPLQTPTFAPIWASPVQDRLASTLAPAHLGLLALVLVAAGHEVLFRGVLLRRAGPVGALVAWVVVATPFDPARGLLTGLVLTALARRRGLAAAIAAHLAWGGLNASGDALPVGARMAAAALAIALAVRRAPTPSAASPPGNA